LEWVPFAQFPDIIEQLAKVGENLKK